MGVISALAAVGLLAVSCSTPSVGELAASAVHVEARPCGRTTNGSGFAVEDDHVLTNAHLVAGSTDDVRVRTEDGRALAAEVVAFDAERDLALLRVNGIEADTLDLEDAEDGSRASIIARPVDSELEVLDAIVVRSFNATGDDIYGGGDVSRRAIELSVDVPSGVSGAGVFGADGELFGVVFAESLRRSDTAYAVGASEVGAFLEEHDGADAADTMRCRDP